MNKRPCESSGARPRPCRLGTGKPKSVNQSMHNGPFTCVSVEQLVFAGLQYRWVHDPAPGSGPRTICFIPPGLPVIATPP